MQMNIKSILGLLALSVSALYLVQCQSAHSANAKKDSFQAVRLELLFQNKDSGKWKSYVDHSMIVAEKGTLTIIQQPYMIYQNKKMLGFTSEKWQDAIGGYQYFVFEKDSKTVYTFSAFNKDSIEVISYDSLRSTSSLLYFDMAWTDTRAQMPKVFEVFKRERAGDSLKIIEVNIKTVDRWLADTIKTYYRKGNIPMSFQFTTALDTVKGMRFEKVEAIDKGDETLGARQESQPFRMSFSVTPIVPDRLEEFERAIKIYKERTK